MVLGGNRDRRRIVSVNIHYRGRTLPAEIVDAGDANVEVHPGDWAIIKVNEALDLPALDVDVDYPFNFATPLLRLGNDYSNGIIAITGYAGRDFGGHSGRSNGGRLPLFVYSSPEARSVPESFRHP